jgi:EAL domain-containing protein (putative c-di-GMP-specific phosphodiesterase class I)
LNLLSDLKRATEQGQLRLVYQPKVALRDGVIASAEALVRWEHPERGMIPPADFLPFAEQTGAIRLITRWVIEEALQQVRRWQLEGRAVQVSVNISARDLADEALVTHVATCLMSAALGPAALCIEITESAMMEDTAVAHATIERLRQLGVAISIDDYGTGYSSLAYIKDLGASELKIDRAFVKDLDRREEDVAIVRSTIELGHNLGLRVVAEGVETLAQLQRLSAFGCDYAQGYLLSRPVPAAEFSAWAASFHLPPMAPPERRPLTFQGRNSA